MPSSSSNPSYYYERSPTQSRSHSRSSSPSPSRSPTMMRRRGSSSISISSFNRSSPEPPSSFSFTSAKYLTCPICNDQLPTTSSAVLDEHVDHCTIRRNMTAASSGSHLRRFSSSSISSVDSMMSPQTSFSMLANDEDDSRYTLSGTGGAVEFGGFGPGESLDQDHDLGLTPGERFIRELRRQREENEMAKRMTRPTKSVPARLAMMRRRLAIDMEGASRS